MKSLWVVAVGFSAVLMVSTCPGQVNAPVDDMLVFQTSGLWSPRVNVEAETVMVYGINDDLPARIASWKEHGYRVALMTGVAWGRYGDYLRGDFGGREHWDETQQEASGKLILHSGREVPYIAPSESYGRYLSRGVLRALDAGVEAVYLEEPEFWARAGWSESFKREWQSYYHEAWQAPDLSPDAQYRASKLKYFLYRRALAQVFDAVKEWGKAHGKTIPCYVATHSLPNYAQWDIVSPESSLLDVGADGYIAQVWTGTARAENVYEGATAERTFETAFLEYGAQQNIARSSGKRIWYLNDPIEDNPNHAWSDYKRNWESTLVASLLQPAVSSYEVLPWPDRIFGPKGLYPNSEPGKDSANEERTPISSEYETELQTVFHALGEMKGQPAHWQTAGTEGIGVLVSDTLMFQRAKPDPSDEYLSNFYGLAMPLLMHGVPVEPVQIESTYRTGDAADFLKHYKVLLLTYEGQKPPSPKFHEAIAEWVRAGGALVMVDDDSDPYNHAADWWNENGKTQTLPRELLFKTLGLNAKAEGMHRVGKGVVIFRKASPTALAKRKDGAAEVLTMTKRAAAQEKLAWHESPSLVMRRGPFVIASGLDGAATETTVSGRFIDLFDAHLGLVDNPRIAPGERRLLLDPGYFPRGTARVLAASGKITNELANGTSIRFSVTSIDGRDDRDLIAIRLALPRDVRSVALDGRSLTTEAMEDGMLLLEFPAKASAQTVEVRF